MNHRNLLAAAELVWMVGRREVRVRGTLGPEQVPAGFTLTEIGNT